MNSCHFGDKHEIDAALSFKTTQTLHIQDATELSSGCISFLNTQCGQCFDFAEWEHVSTQQLTVIAVSRS